MHLSHRLPCLVLLLASLVILSSPAQAGWRAGAAKVNITPSYPVRLSGYGSRTTEFEGVKADIWVKVLALAWDDAPPVVVMTVDNVGVPFTVRDEVLAGLKDGHITTERLAICSTHTHCAPMLKGNLANMFGVDLPADQQERIDRYTKELTASLIKAAHEALAGMQPAVISLAHGQVAFAHNRRLAVGPGYANSPNPTGPTDHDLPVLKIADEKGMVKAIFTSYACHCTTLGWNFIHPDWAGMAQAALEKAFPGAVALTAIGCGADQNPYPRHEEILAQLHGDTLAAEAVRLVKGYTMAAGDWKSGAQDLKPLQGPLSCGVRNITLSYDTLPTREQWEKQSAQGKTPHERHLAGMFLAMLARNEPVPQELPYLVQAWTFGDGLAMVFLNGEVVVDYSLRLKKEYDPARMWVNSYSNNVPCYIPSERVLKEGGYEGAGAMIYYARPTKFAPGLEDKIIGAVHELVPEGFKAK